MTKIKYPRKELEKHINLDEQTIERISLFGSPLESINESEVELEISANRPDLFSLHGLIRSLVPFLKKTEKLPAYKLITEGNYRVKVETAVKEVRPYTRCAIIKNIPVTEENIKELMYLQEKIHSTLGRQRKNCALGIYPLDKISFPLIYTALKPKEIKFIPLGMTEELSSSQILEKHPVGKEYASLLENASLYPVFIDAKKKILSMPPIINSQETGRITLDTKDLFIECSGHDTNTLDKVITLVATTCAEMGGKIVGVTIEDSEKKMSPSLEKRKIKLSPENIGKYLGLKLSEKELTELLHRMGHVYKHGSVSIPTWRSDILHEVDIIEDVAIAYGYDKLVPEIPSIATTGEESKESRFHHKVMSILTGLGFLEASSLHLIKEEELGNQKDAFYVENSRTEYKILRPNLLIPSLRTLAENTDAEYPQKIAEIGKVFLEGATETGIKEEERLILALTPGNITEMKRILDYIFQMFSMSYELKESSVKGCIEGRAGTIHVNNLEIGYIGEAHPSLLNDWHLKMPLSLVEIKTSEFYKQFA